MCLLALDLFNSRNILLKSTTFCCCMKRETAWGLFLEYDQHDKYWVAIGSMTHKNKSRRACNSPTFIGGPSWARTRDLLIKSYCNSIYGIYTVMVIV